MSKYIIKKEMMGGTWHYMIYRRFLWLDFFVERWNTETSAKTRVAELENPISLRVPYY